MNALLKGAAVCLAAAALLSPPAASQTTNLARALQFNAWASNGADLANEPILHPQDLDLVIRSCKRAAEAGEMERCSENEEDLRLAAKILVREPKVIWKIADCFTTGCDGALPKALTNACLWWSFYNTLFDKIAGKYSQELNEFACARAQTMPAERNQTLRTFFEAMSTPAPSR